MKSHNRQYRPLESEVAIDGWTFLVPSDLGCGDALVSGHDPQKAEHDRILESLV